MNGNNNNQQQLNECLIFLRAFDGRFWIDSPSDPDATVKLDIQDYLLAHTDANITLDNIVTTLIADYQQNVESFQNDLQYFHGNINDLRDHIRRNLIVQAHDCAIFINMLNSQHAINNNIGNNLNNGNKENTTPNMRRS